jgi:uncharacterized protein YdeI (YjbR/CyaY-like superfamily)
VAGAEVDELILPDVGAWRVWLDAHHDDSPGVWLVLAKGTVAGGPTQLVYDEALDEALCQGWIDGQKRGRDSTSWRQRFTPRRARSPWSKRNTAIATRLIDDGRMCPAGQAEVDRARDDGRWTAAYEGQARMEVPDDLAAALAAEPAAAAFFDELDSANRYSVLYRIGDAKRPDTRARRIEQFVAMLARGETLHPRRAPRGRSS